MNIKAPIIMELIFIAISVFVYLTTSNIFFIFNFLYIGTAIAVGLFLMAKNNMYARNLVMLAVGSYLLFYVGILGYENLSLSGFWYYLSLGVFEAAVIHFLIAKNPWTITVWSWMVRLWLLDSNDTGFTAL